MSGWQQVGRGRALIFDGPFFQRDPALTVRQNIHRVVAQLAQEGEKLERSLTPFVTGETRESMHATVDRNAASLFSAIRIVPSGPGGSAAYPRAAWLETGVRRRKRSAGHSKLGTTWNKQRKGQGLAGVVHMKKRPPQPVRRTYLSLRTLKPGIERELTRGLE